MKYKIYNQDVIEWAKTYDKIKFHALLSDPPYHLTSIVKRFGKNGSAPAKHGTDGVFQRASSGFMGQTWDGGDIAFNPETWALLGEHLYDGAFGFAFAASRNWHRLAVAIEDAGFIIHPTIFCWVQGQGFPKATRIDKKAKDEAWSGHRYGLQALKPAVEPIICFQKPYNGKPLDNITQTGAGALNIDAARIPLQADDEYVINTFDDGAKPWGEGAGHEYTSRTMKYKPKGIRSGSGNYVGDNYKETQPEVEVSGRWPANFVVDDVTAQRLNQQTGVLTSGKPSGKKSAENMVYGKYKNEDIDVKGFGDSGGASRFFFNVSTALDESDPIFYCAKASSREKNAGLDDFEPTTTTDGRKKSIDNPYLRGEILRRNTHPNTHPTVKPISLTKWLATLLLPPDMYAPRNLLVPFSGVGSEMIGGLLAGWDRILGIEKDTENNYVDMSYKRLEYYANAKDIK